MTRKVCKAAIELIKKYESAHDGDLSVIGLQPKMCPANVWTVGFGRALRKNDGTYLRGEKDKDEAYARFPSLTLDEAEAMLAEDLWLFSEKVAPLIHTNLTDNQFGACVSLAYNIGVGAFAKSTALKRINEKRWLEAANAFLLWTKAGGKVLPGLQRRREEERHLFYQDVGA